MFAGQINLGGSLNLELEELEGVQSCLGDRLLLRLKVESRITQACKDTHTLTETPDKLQVNTDT